MQTANGNRLVIFVHVPKAAGSSLASILRSQYGRAAVYSAMPRDQLPGLGIHTTLRSYDELPQKRKERIKILRGNFIFDPRPDLNAACFTMLREPVNRVVSLYYFCKSRESNLFHDSANRMSLHEFVASRVTLETSNDQTRRLAGAGDEAGALERAKINIREKFALTGITELFDESVLQLGKIFGWKPYYQTANVTRERAALDSIPKETLDLIAVENQIDAELYRFARQRFEKNVAEMGVAFQRELEAFRRWNRVYSIYFTVETKWHRSRRGLRRLLARA